jgi:MFS family permease
VTFDRPTIHRWTPYGVAVALAAVYLVWAPHSTDLAAQTARAELFRRSGYVPFWSGWYSGVATASYSLVTPPLLGWFGPLWLGALSIIATSLVVVPLLRDAVRPTAGASFFVVTATLNAVSGRTTFAVGAVIALSAVLAAERRRPAVAVLLAVVATAASPVAGFLVLIVAAALLLADHQRRFTALLLGAAVIAVLALLAFLARGESGGYQPFSQASMLQAAGTAAVVGVVSVGPRVRVAAALTIAMLLVVYFVHSPIGSNATRLSLLVAGPVVVAAARVRLPVLAVATVAASALLVSQLHYDLATTSHHDSARSFVAPLASRLAGDPALRGSRVELVDTATHWPSTYLLPDVALARGWERQVDESRNPLFYGRAPLDATTYRAFLDRNAVGAVAVAVGVPLDFGMTREATLVAGGLPYLHEIWSDAHWRLYDVARPTRLVASPARVVALEDTGLTVDVPSAGQYFVRMRWSPYLVVNGGSVGKTGDGEVRLSLDAAGSHRLHAVWRVP